MKETSPETRPGRSARRILLVLVIVLFGLPLAYSAVRQEVSQWRLAASFEKMLRGDLPGAVQCLDTAISWSPDWAELYAQRAGYLIDQGDAASALPDCDRALELARAEWTRDESPATLQRLALALNQRAYAYALHRSNMEVALENIDEAIELAGSDYQFLDTRGYLHLLLDNVEKATDDIELAVQLAEIKYKAIRNDYLSLRRDSVDRRPADHALQRLEDSFAVIYHHRGELYEKLGQADEAQRDLDRAQRLGYNPAKGIW
jgi:tetratricopeptide (TPR) repeat protein